MAESVIANADDASLGDLTRLAQSFADAVEDGSIANRYETNQSFHVALANLCSNRELIKLVLDLRGYVPASPMSQWPDMVRARLSSAEHFDIIGAIGRGNAVKLKSLLATHIMQPGTEI